LNTAWSEKQNVVRPADKKPSFSPIKIYLFFVARGTPPGCAL